MKNSIKRAQSQACLGFAERKNFRPLAKLKKLTLMLVALLALTTGAWAQTENEVTVTPVTGKTNQWTFTMPAFDVELTPIYAPEFTAAFKAGNANTIQSGKATVAVTESGATTGTQVTLDENGNYKPLYEEQKITLTAAPGYKFRKVEVKKKAAGKPLANATTEDLGKVVGADGNIYDSKDAAEAVATGNAVAMICYVNEGHGLALALTDISYYHSWDNSSSYNEGKTAAELCSAWNTSKAVTGATWKLASKSEMNLMINAAGNYVALRDGFSAVGGTNMSDEYYWLSDESTADYAKNINFSDGHTSQEFKYDNEKVRACLEW